MACWVFFFLFSLPFAVSYSVTNSLPGFHGPLPFDLETGYVGVGESERVQLFYYFIKSERNPKEDPVLVWLTGGPGCSSISGLVLENGPLKFKLEEYNGTVPTLLASPDSWTKVASILFLDQPAGTGFSYATDPDALLSSDMKSARQVDEFVRKWLIDHPEFLSNPFYVGGDSYSGITVPPITLHISNGNEQGLKPYINLQGYVLGNPLTDESLDNNAAITFSHRMALISDELYESLKTNCRGQYQIVDPGNVGCSIALHEYRKCISDINLALTSDDTCDAESPDCTTYGYILSEYWANDRSVREALNIRKGKIGRWNRCNKYTIPYTKDIPSSFPYHVNLSAKGYRSLVYSGDHDMIISYVGTQEWIRALNYSIVDDWRPWKVLGQVKGYTRTYSNRMTFATIKGGGHTAEFMRTPYQYMFKRWIDGEPL